MNSSEKTLRKIAESEYSEELSELVWITNRLMKMKILIFSCIPFSLLFLSTFIILIRYTSYNFALFNDVLWGISLVLLFVGISYLLRFSILKNRGMVLYDELTDEVDWSNKRKEYIRKSPIKMRIVIKDFIMNTNLLFSNTKKGEILYLLIYISMILFSITMRLFLSQKYYF